MNLNYSYNIFFFLLSVNPCLSQKSSLLTYIIIAVGIELWMALIKLPSPGKNIVFTPGPKIRTIWPHCAERWRWFQLSVWGLRISAPWTVGKVPPILHQSIWHPSQYPTPLPPHPTPFHPHPISSIPSAFGSCNWSGWGEGGGGGVGGQPYCFKRYIVEVVVL